MSLLGPLSGKTAIYCSDASITRYLVARNWNVKKATKMLKETIKWRVEYKPDEICWVSIVEFTFMLIMLHIISLHNMILLNRMRWLMRQRQEKYIGRIIVISLEGAYL
jgi:DNA polymerase elongation subunit (family B)